MFSSPFPDSSNPLMEQKCHLQPKRRRASLAAALHNYFVNGRVSSGGVPFDLLDRSGIAVMLPRSVDGVVPDAALIRIPAGGLRSELSYETTISAKEDTAGAAARLSRPQLEQERARHSVESPPGRTQAFDPGIKSRPMADSILQRLRFGRAARIKQGRDFARVRRGGERLVIGCLIANWQRLPAVSASRLGVITSGKIGNAVVRNRARRLMRETFRLHQHDLAGPVDLVLVARNSIAGKGFADVERDFLTTLRKARLLKPVSERIE